MPMALCRQSEAVQTCEMVNTWVRGTGAVSATGMLTFYSLGCLSSQPHPTPEYELLELFSPGSPAPGTTWQVAGAQ